MCAVLIHQLSCHVSGSPQRKPRKRARERRYLMATANPTHGLHAPGSILKKASGWLIAIGVFFIILGILAIAEPLVAGLAITFLVGWLLIVGGAVHFVAAFAGGGAARVIVQILIGVVYLAGGLYFLTHTLLGLGTLTLARGHHPRRSRLRNRLLFSSPWIARLQLAAHQRTHHPLGRGSHLVSLALQLRLGHRHPGRRKPPNDRHLPRNDRHGRPKSPSPRLAAVSESLLPSEPTDRDRLQRLQAVMHAGHPPPPARLPAHRHPFAAHHTRRGLNRKFVFVPHRLA